MDMEKLEQPSLQQLNGSASKEKFSMAAEHFDEKLRTIAEEIQISIGKTLIVAEKQSLIRSSPYFASLLKFHGDSMNALGMVPPDNVSPGNFLAVLHTLSNRSVKLNINASNLWDFVVLSKYFQLDEMEKECLDVLRKQLPTLGMDKLCELWRSGRACAFDKVTSLVLAGISLKIESAIQSREFLDLTVAELVALLSDVGFLPLMEVDICKAVIAWIEHDPEHRKKPSVLTAVLDKVVWEASTNDLLAPFVDLRGEPGQPPERAKTSECPENPSAQLLAEVQCDSGIIIGEYFYGVEGLHKYRDFHRISLTNWERASWEEIEPEYESDDEPAQYRFCHVKLSGRDYIGFLLSSWMDMTYQYYGEMVSELINTMALYDTEKQEWMYLPHLPLPRIDTTMIQCGTFLYVVGGNAYKPYEGGNGNGRHCYRLDLSHLPNGPNDEFEGEWERIADLHSPRVKHGIKIDHGRIVVYGGQTQTGVDGDKTFEDARWSEAYDTVLNIWTMFKPT